MITLFSSTSFTEKTLPCNCFTDSLESRRPHILLLNQGNSRCKGNGNRAHAHNGVVQPAQGVRNSNDNNYSDTRYYNGQSTMVGRSRGQQRSPPVYRRTPPNQQQSAPNLTSWSYANRGGTEADDCY